MSDALIVQVGGETIEVTVGGLAGPQGETGPQGDSFGAFADPAPTAEYATTLARIAIPENWDEDGNDKAVDWTVLNIAKNYFASPPGSDEATYPTMTASMGWNIGDNGNVRDTDFIAFGDHWEYYYWQEGVLASERQLRFYDIDGVEHRLWQTFMPHDWATDGALSAFQTSSGRFRVYDQDDVPLILGDNANRVWDIAEGLKFRFAENNVPVLAQFDSAMAEVPLPYIDDLDGLRQSAPTHHVSGAKENPNGNTSYVYRALEAPATGYYGEQVILAAAITAGGSTFIDRFFSGAVNGNITSQRTNSHATGGLRIEQTTTAGDIIEFNQIGGSFFARGTRASDGAYCISPSGFLLDDGLVVRQNGRVGIATVPPANASAAGKQGDVTWDAGFIYVCTADNTWKRSAIATW